ncbi:MAG: hypothetical protein M1839_006048 [Geoglossum umbratile]|nr:MAG: hypothetical protein M1839_006048 [Geoglossum umbratile]
MAGLKLLPRVTPSAAAFVVLVVFTFNPLVAAFDRETCLTTVTEMINNQTLLGNSSVFFRDRNGIYSNITNPILTYKGCMQYCGANQTWYRDIGPRLTVWLLPICYLISNLEVSPLDKRRYVMVLHLLGDPIDSMWSLLTKAEAYCRCCRIAGADEVWRKELVIWWKDMVTWWKWRVQKMTRRMRGDRAGAGDGPAKGYLDPAARHAKNTATILAAIEELVGTNEDGRNRNPDHYLPDIPDIPDVKRVLVAETACELAESRTDEVLRTWFAVILYLFQLAAGFVAAIGGGNSSPPGGRIGTAMLLTWLIPVVLLSNHVGGFTSRRTCLQILEPFAKDMDLRGLLDLVRGCRADENYFDSQSWSGSIYTYRPGKNIFSAGKHPFWLLLLSIAPVYVSASIAFSIIWHTVPDGMSCRNLMVLGLALGWFLSAFLTWATWNCGLRGKSHWWFTIIKDFIIGIPSIVIIFLSCCGLFNSCWCWSAWYSLHENANVPLNANVQFEQRDRKLYPKIVSVCLCLQFCIFGLIMWFGRRGLGLMRWSEEERKRIWKRVDSTRPQAAQEDRERAWRRVNSTELRAVGGRVLEPNERE